MNLTARAFGRVRRARARRRGRCPDASCQSAATGPVAARRRPDHRPGAGLSAADQQVGRQPARLPRRARLKQDGAKDQDVRRHLRDRAHASRQTCARSSSRICKISKIDFPTLPDRGASIAPELSQGVRGAGAHDGARQAPGIAGGRRRQAADGGSRQHAAAGHREQLAGDPGADRRRAGDEAGAGQRALPARHQHARAHPAGRPRAELLHPRLRWLALGERDPARGRSRSAQPLGMDDARDRAREERTPSTC